MDVAETAYNFIHSIGWIIGKIPALIIQHSALNTAIKSNVPKDKMKE